MMNKHLKTALLAVILLTVSYIAGAISPDGTYLFIERESGKLYMDVYEPADGSIQEIDGVQKPTIIFMFGGGFIGGERDNKAYWKWFETMTQNGYRIISIDYRLGLKGVSKMGVTKVNTLDKAIHMAVEDLFCATRFIIENADQLGVDPDNLVISGSSAGAISVMQADYELSNGNSCAAILPEDFRYAGVMSFSGAILSREGKVDYAREPAPTLMLHGTKDKLVEYKQIRFFNLGWFGGGKLVERFEKFGYSYNMYHFIDYGHEIAGSMETTTDLQMMFLETNVMKQQKRQLEAWLNDPGVYKGYGPQSRRELYKRR